METEIYHLMSKIIYEQSVNKLYNEKAEFFEYPIKVERITFDIVDIFNNMYFNKYKDCLIHNAAIEAIKNNDTKYIALFEKNNIDKLINSDRIVKAMITQRAFYNISLKIQHKQNLDDAIKNNNFELYKKLNKSYKMEVITKKLRKTILSFLNNYDKSNYEIIIDLLLATNKLDEDIIKFDNFFNANNLKEYKNLLFRIILSDNYLYLKSLQKDTSLENNDSFYQSEDEDDEFVEYMDEEIINLLENSDWSRINDYEVRISLYSNFIVYNVLLNKQKEDFKNIKGDKTAIKTLKKINPYYFLDMI